jgi:hypothetical protein
MLVVVCEMKPKLMREAALIQRDSEGRITCTATQWLQRTPDGTLIIKTWRRRRAARSVGRFVKVAKEINIAYVLEKSKVRSAGGIYAVFLSEFAPLGM